VNYNAGEWLQRSIDSVAAQSFHNFECLIIDNASSDGSAEALHLPDERFRLLKLNQNLGFAGGNNHAAREARGDWLALLNPDAFAAPDWLERLYAARLRLPNTVMVGSLQRMALEPGILDGAGDFYHFSGLAWRAKFGFEDDGNIEDYEAFGPCAAAALYRADMFHDLGGFDESFFCYHEDVDLAFRMRLMGGRCVQAADAIVDHVSSGISGRASPFAVYHGTRNRIWTFFKNMPLPLLIILTPAHLGLTLFLFCWSSVRARRFKPTIKGMWDGYRGIGGALKARKTIQPFRKISIWTLMKSFAWSPLSVRKRDLPSVKVIPEIESRL